MKRKTSAAVLAAILWSGALAMAAGANEAATAQKIRGVENGLVEFNPAAPPTAAAPILRTLAERMAFYKVPGVSIAVINQNRIEWAKGYGVLKAGEGAAVTPESFFEAASTTKAVIAAIVLGLVQEGKLDLDVDVNTYLRS